MVAAKYAFLLISRRIFANNFLALPKLYLFNNEIGRQIGKKYYGLSGNGLGKAVINYFGSYNAFQNATKKYGTQLGLDTMLADMVMKALKSDKLKVLE